MGKKRLKKGIESYEKQLKEHIRKFREAESRGDVGAMNYMAREMKAFMEERDKRRMRTLPRKKRVKLKKGKKH